MLTLKLEYDPVAARRSRLLANAAFFFGRIEWHVASLNARLVTYVVGQCYHCEHEADYICLDDTGHPAAWCRGCVKQTYLYYNTGAPGPTRPIYYLNTDTGHVEETTWTAVMAPTPKLRPRVCAWFQRRTT